MHSASKGFTVIEIMATVLVTAVLTAVVLVNLGRYLNRGEDSSIKGGLSTIVTNSIVYFEARGTYNNFCSSTLFTGPEDSILKSNGGVSGINTRCVATAGAMCACASLTINSQNVFCVDSTGYKKESPGSCDGACSALAKCVW